MNSKMKFASQPWVRSGAILAIIDYLEREGLDPRPIVGNSGMRIAEVADCYRQVDLHNIMSILENVTVHTRRPEIPLLVGLSANLNNSGPFGLIYLNAPTIGDALHDYVRYSPAWQTQAHFGLEMDEHGFCFEYSSNHMEMTGWELDSEITIGYHMAIINAISDKPVIPDEVHFDHGPLFPMTQYEKILSSTVVFNQKTNRLFYPLKILDKSISGADPVLYNVLRRHLSDLLEEMPNENDLVQVVRNNIKRGMGSNTITLEYIASEVDLEPRTLQRKLNKQGTSFKKILDGVRFSQARDYLEKTTLHVTQIALELGFSDVSAFDHAFKRWSGTTPGQYRKKEKMGFD